MVRRGLRAKARWAGAGLAMFRHDRARAATAGVSDQSGLAGGGQCLRAVTVSYAAACRPPEVWLALLDWGRITRIGRLRLVGPTGVKGRKRS